MMPRGLGIAALLAAPFAAYADRHAVPLDAAAFDAQTQGQTLDWGRAGQIYGRETYSPQRRVVWQDAAGRCQNGTWTQDSARHICFHYEGNAHPQCWQFHLREGQLVARAKGQGPQTELAQIGPAHTRPLTCAPEVGA